MQKPIIPVWALSVILGPALAAQDRVVKGQEPAWPPTSGKSTFMLSPSRRSQARSLKELIDASKIIVDATVQEVLPARVLPHRLETDAVLSVNRIIAGPKALNSFVVAQNGGILGGFTEEPAQYSMMRVGDHYLLFGKEEVRTNLPAVRGLPRYAITGVWTGAVEIDSSGRVHFPRASYPALHLQYDGTAMSDFLGQLTALLP